MTKSTGIELNGRYVEQHGLKDRFAADARTESHGSSEAAAGGTRSVLECLSAGRKFARQCEIDGITNRGFRI